MVHAVPDILARIVETKRAELAGLGSVRADLERRAAARADFRDFRAALTRRSPAITSKRSRSERTTSSVCCPIEPVEPRMTSRFVFNRRACSAAACLAGAW